MQVSLLGVGGGYVSLLDEEAARAIYRRAIELGVTYFDGRYGDTNAKLRPLMQAERRRFLLATKTAEISAAGALGRIEEDLRELGTDYLDIFYLRTYNQEMLDKHGAPGGSIEGVLKAKEQGKVRALGLAGHSDLIALARGIGTGVVDVCMFPLNLGRLEGLQQVVPIARQHDVGLVVMKPMAVGLVPAHVSLPWLANQPIHTMIPGVSSLAQLELDVQALERPSPALSPAENEEAARWQKALATTACHICDRVCQPVCEAKIPIDQYLYHDVYYNLLRAHGVQGVLDAPLAPWARGRAGDYFRQVQQTIAACTHCDKCEAVCPYHLPIVSLLERIAAECQTIVDAVTAAGWPEKYRDAELPFAGPTGKGRQIVV